MAEGSLERYRFADERVQAEVQGLRPPADLGNAPIGPHQFHRLLQRLADTGGVDDQVGAKAIAERTDQGHRIVLLNVERIVRAQLGRDLHALGVCVGAEDNECPCAAYAGDLQGP